MTTLDQLDGSSGSLAISGSKPPREVQGRPEAPGGRGRHTGQDKSFRMGQHAVEQLHRRMEPSRRADAGGLRPKSEPVGQQQRLRRRHGPRYFFRCHRNRGAQISFYEAVSGFDRSNLDADQALFRLMVVWFAPPKKSGIVAIKPTVGLVSRDRIVPLSLRQDTAGPMSRTVKDAAQILSAIADPDGHDEFTDKDSV